MVNPGSGVDAGKPMFTIADVSTLWIIANVPESQIQRLHIGTSAQVRTAALGSRVLSGRVSYIDTQLNQETGTAQVRIEPSTPDGLLKVGMFAEVSFQIRADAGKSGRDRELVVPSE